MNTSIVSKSHISICYINYLINIIPNFVFYVSLNNILIIHFNPMYLHFFFFFLYNHHNTQLKMFIDLTTADFLACKRRFVNIYNLLSLDYNTRLFCKT